MHGYVVARRHGDFVLVDGKEQRREVEYGWDYARGVALRRTFDGDGHLLLRGRQIGGGGETRYLGVGFHRTGSAFHAVYADLDKVFQLTPAEYRVLGEMIEGRTADAIARAMKLSIETVRSHIRHIYTKLQVSSREELFSKIRPYRL